MTHTKAIDAEGDPVARNLPRQIANDCRREWRYIVAASSSTPRPSFPRPHTHAHARGSPLSRPGPFPCAHLLNVGHRAHRHWPAPRRGAHRGELADVDGLVRDARAPTTGGRGGGRRRRRAGGGGEEGGRGAARRRGRVRVPRGQKGAWLSLVAPLVFLGRWASRRLNKRAAGRTGRGVGKCGGRLDA